MKVIASEQTLDNPSVGFDGYFVKKRFILIDCYLSCSGQRAGLPPPPADAAVL